MKNFLIEFFRPLDNLIFNYLVKAGFVKPIVGALVGGFLQSRAASKAQKAQEEATNRNIQLAKDAAESLRDPVDILTQAFDTGIYGDDAMSAILGAESRLIPQFQALQEQRLGGVIPALRDVQEESKLRQLGMLGTMGSDIRSALQDPRLAQIADADLAEAMRLTEESRGPLGFMATRTADQSAAAFGTKSGRSRDASTLAKAVLGRDDALRDRRNEAAKSRLLALQSGAQAAVDPLAFLTTPSAEERFASAILRGPLTTQVTDPGSAINLGSALDVAKAQALLGQGQIGAMGAAASSNILAQSLQGLGSTLGNVDFSGITNALRPSSPVTLGSMVSTTGSNALNQANQISNQLGSIGNIGLTLGQTQQSTPFGGYTFP